MMPERLAVMFATMHGRATHRASGDERSPGWYGVVLRSTAIASTQGRERSPRAVEQEAHGHDNGAGDGAARLGQEAVAAPAHVEAIDLAERHA